MSQSINRYRRALIAALAVSPFVAFAQDRLAFSELSPPLPVDTGGKIEVTEFFWYGCIHCYNLEPDIESWLKRLPPDVQFRRVPAVFRNRLALDAAIFYTFESLGLLDRLHRPFFDAIHKDGLKTENRAALDEWLQKQGVDLKKFGDALKSFGVQSKVRRATQLTIASKIDGTPAMLVQGKYGVSASQAGASGGFMKVIDQLVDRVRKQK